VTQRQGVPVYAVNRFREKPAIDLAEQFVAAGDYFWNAGIFVWKTAAILRELHEQRPELAAAVGRIADAWDTPRRDEVLRREYPAAEKISIDYAVMEKARKVLVLRAPYKWDDVGSWLALERMHPQDADGNTVLATHAGLNTTHCVVVGDAGSWSRPSASVTCSSSRMATRCWSPTAARRARSRNWSNGLSRRGWGSSYETPRRGDPSVGAASLANAGIARPRSTRRVAARSADPRHARLVGHAFTALGLVAAALIALCVIRDDYRTAFLLMLAATVIDAVDGTYARAVGVKTVLPGFDGRRLDDLIDFHTYTTLPLLLVWRAGLLPPGDDAWLLLPLVASAYGFCRVEAKTADGYFLGFPSYWNIVAFYLYALPWPPAWALNRDRRAGPADVRGRRCTSTRRRAAGSTS